MSNKFVLVTGGSGFLGGHIVHQLLADGQRVRAIVRSGKGHGLKEAYSHYGDKLDLAIVDDFVNGNFYSTFIDVASVVHAAAPMPSSIENPEEALKTAIEGTLNIFRQAEKAGIRNFAYVSSVIALDLSSPPPITDKSWNLVTREQALESRDPFFIYGAEKTLAEKAVWEFVDAHPHVELVTVNPPFIYGPFAPSYRNETGKEAALSTNRYIYSLLNPVGTLLFRPQAIDVRDVAKAVILCLKAPPTSQVGRKRLLISGEWFSAKDAAELIAKSRPELKNRLSKEAFKAAPAPKNAFDISRAQEILGLTFIDWQDTILAAVDDLIKLENNWNAKGVTPS